MESSEIISYIPNSPKSADTKNRSGEQKYTDYKEHPERLLGVLDLW
jgi:hypothetical protein